MAKGLPQEQPKLTTTASGIKARGLAVAILVALETKGSSTTATLHSAFQKQSLSVRDRAFVTALVQGVVRHRNQIDKTLANIVSKPLTKLTPSLRNVLRLSVFQLEHMKDIPASAVLNTANEIAKSKGHQGLAKFVNGVLRNYLRNQTESKTAVHDNSDLPELSCELADQYSMPKWLVERWLTIWGAIETKNLLEATCLIPKLQVRTNTYSITPDGLKAMFETKGIKCHQGQLVPSVLIIDDRKQCRGPISVLPGFAEGLFSVQDEAAAFVSIVLDPKPTELIIDLCAAPGGKTIHLAELLANKGRIIAVDDSTSRLDLLKKSRQRIGLTNIEIIATDACTFTPETLADKVLLDAPCTGTGVLNQRSDMRFNRQLPDLPKLVALQRQLLTNAATMVKPYGRLVYSTCSLEPEENLENMSWFLSQHPEFKVVDITSYLADELLASWMQTDPGCASQLKRGVLQLLPSRHHLSGFFIAVMQREAKSSILN